MLKNYLKVLGAKNIKIMVPTKVTLTFHSCITQENINCRELLRMMYMHLKLRLFPETRIIINWKWLMMTKKYLMLTALTTRQKKFDWEDAFLSCFIKWKIHFNIFLKYYFSKDYLEKIIFLKISLFNFELSPSSKNVTNPISF